VYLLRQSELSNNQIGNLLGLSKQRVQQINAALRLDGFFDLAAELETEGEQS
jgi:DNA-directed RNA polymerase specialized sigma subunit